MVTTASKILSDIKILVGVSKDDNNFDDELTMHINSVIATLTQLGVGPDEGFEIDKETIWQTLVGDRKDFADIKTYMFKKIQLIFDPPQNSFLVSAIEKQCSEYEWRIEART